LQAPTIIFDHVNNSVTILGGVDAKLAELAAAQQDLVTTSGQPSK
jgi:hypothetical protein